MCYSLGVVYLMWEKCSVIFHGVQSEHTYKYKQVREIIWITPNFKNYFNEADRPYTTMSIETIN